MPHDQSVRFQFRRRRYQYPLVDVCGDTAVRGWGGWRWCKLSQPRSVQNARDRDTLIFETGPCGQPKLEKKGLRRESRGYCKLMIEEQTNREE